jgi:O-antigen ligase
MNVSPTLRIGEPPGLASAVRVAAAGICLALAALITIRYPVMPAVMAGTLLAYGAALWRWPNLWLVVVPAMLPALDLTPWTGWLLIGEYDLFGLVTVGILLVRTPLMTPDFVMRGVPGIALALSVVTCLTGVILGIASPLDVPRQSDLAYLRPDNAFRLANGFVLALILMPFLRERLRAGQPVAAWFAAGMTGGLALVALATVLERALFPGLLNFTADYRVVATFSSMHVGGGHIGAYIAMALPFLIVCLLKPRYSTALLMLCVAAAASYSLVVTFARTAYVAAIVGTLVVLVGWASSRRGRDALGTVALIALFIAIVVGFLATAMLEAGIMSQRFVRWAPDLATREGNWTGGLQLRDTSLSTTLFGMGLGTYPRAALGRHRSELVPSNFAVKRAGGENYLSMTVGAPDYFEQKILIVPGQAYKLSMELRSPDDRASLTAALCEKLLLYSDNCRHLSFKPKNTRSWESFSAAISAEGLDRDSLLGIFRRPVVLSLFDLAPNSTIEIKHVRLTDTRGQDIIANGDFTKGVERWYFTDDNHLVWRMKNMYLMILFESGLLGMLSFVVLVGAALYGAFLAMRRGERMGAAIAASLAAFLCSGLFDHLLEAPRLAALFYLVCFVALTMWDSFAPPAQELGELLLERPEPELLQPSPRISQGPIRFATGRGSFFQVSIMREYLGLSGFLSGMLWPGRKWYSYSSHSGTKPQFFLKENAPVPALLRPKSNRR